jgi:phage/plasmid-like protein (TIGR03299 family)
VQNEVLWDLIDQLVQEPNVQYETAGCLKGGSVLWVLAKLHEPVQIKGDNTAILPYVIVSTAHDGSQSLEAAALDVRVICWNTFVAGRERARSAGTTYRFRHTKNVMDRVESAREALGLVRNSFRVFVDMMNELAEMPVTDEGVKDFIATLIPEPAADVLTERQKENVREARMDVWDVLQGETVAPAHRLTAYGLFCAGVEYADHLRAYKNPTTYFERNVSYQPMKEKIAELAAACAKN